MANEAEVTKSFTENIPPRRVLLGPGPSELDPEVMRAMTLPQLGHVDPAMLDILKEVQVSLREAFRTRNELTIAVSGTGTSGMQASLYNTVQPGDDVVIGVIGYFGDRLAQMAERIGAKVTKVEAEWGKPLDLDKLREAVQRIRPRVIGIVHGETSTGVAQTGVADIGKIAHEADALLIVDTVASLGGHTFDTDRWDVDVCYSGSQKALGAPSGLAPLTLNERAMARLRERQVPVPSYYLDALELEKYWQGGQYHHTISAPMVYALRTALTKLHDEGLERRWARHKLNYSAFRVAVETMGLSVLAAPECALWTVAGVLLPEKLDASAVQKALLTEHHIEVAGGLGSYKGRMLRVGLMGYGSQRRYVLQLLAALEQVLRAQGHSVPSGAGLSKAMEVYEAEE